MVEYRPFTVRRTTGGDILRQSDPAAWFAALRWGARIVLPEEVEGTGLLARPYFYEGAVITVQVPMTVEWEQAVLVRGGFGYPTTPQDGVTIWYTDTRPEINDTEVNLSQEVIDKPLTPNNWYYYSLFLWIGNQWVLAAQMDVLVPKDWGFSDLLFASIPEFYQRTDYQEAADGRIGPLKRFTSVLGYDLDYTQSLCDGLLHLYDFDKAPWRLLQHLGDNMGFPYEATLGANRTRSVLEQLADLNDLRGTRLGLQRLITAASDYECDVLEGYNDMLAVDDGDFAGGGGSGLVGNADPMLWGIGHWVPMTDTTLLDTIIDPTGTFDASPAAATPPIIAKNTTAGPANILSPPGGRGALVVNGPGPQTVISCGQIDSTGEPEHDQNSVILAGIPVRPGDLYEFSVETIRTAWGSAGEQPPQARVVLAIMWFDTDGAHLSTTNGPDVPDNYDEATWERSMVQEFAPDDSVYAVPAIWWRVVSGATWAGAWTDPLTRPTYGRYISMVLFGAVQTVEEGGDVVPTSPDIFLTLGVGDKTLASDESYLGEP